MAGAGLTFARLDPAARRVLEQYTAELAAGLAGPRPVRAAMVGLAGLGTALASSATTASSPPAGLLVLPTLFGAILAVALPAAVMSVLATGRVARWLPIGPAMAPTAAGLAAVLCVAGDLLLLAGLLAWATTLGGPAWPLAVLAATASATRLTLAGRAARRCVAARRLLA